ncbi:RDD family protein [Streptomyces sp. YIM 98790]|uniref:RDD family protein n=1 Tax=Streptomyces sp. YIM 98790 TaxID=2689077 RepID=UPI001409B029|nr:RDD family protein [Streptomyces sp. YIM 98790]
MSVPPEGGAGGNPGPDWYPDPSIPGYIRYWNGSAWVPGSSRPEPRAGEPRPGPPPGAFRPQPASGPPAPSPSTGPQETGPVFFDEENAAASGPPAAGASPSAGAGAGRAPAVPEPRDSGEQPAQRPAALPELRGRGGADRPGLPWGSDEDVSTSPVASVRRGPQGGQAPADPRAPFGRPAAGPEPERPAAAGGAGSGEEPDPRERTIGIRRSELPGGPSWTEQVRELAQQAHERRAQDQQPGTPPQGRQAQPLQPPQPQAGQPVPRQAPQAAPQSPPQQFPAPPVAQQHQPQPQARQPQPQVPQPQVQQSQGHTVPVLGAPQMAPLTEAGLQVRATAPWESPFGGGEQAYPAKLGRRLLARIVDSLLPLGAAGAVAFLLLDRGRDHIQAKVDAVEQAGVTQQVWLLDGTTGTYLAMVLGAFLALGLLLEALPTAFWGRTPGKALFGLRVLHVERQEKPSFGAALGRWLLYSVLGLVVLGVVSVLWCVRDRPWRQCWHDKAAGTFVASARSGR